MAKEETQSLMLRIYMEVNGHHLEEVKRIEVQDSNIIGQNSIRVVLKPMKEQKYNYCSH